MRALLLTVVAFLSACSNSDERKSAETMDKIEKLIVLPEGAAALDQYARYYVQKEGKVYALYDTPLPYMPVESGLPLKAGQREWLGENQDLPVVLDGGCNVIDVVFDLNAQEFERNECNGPS